MSNLIGSNALKAKSVQNAPWSGGAFSGLTGSLQSGGAFRGGAFSGLTGVLGAVAKGGKGFGKAAAPVEPTAAAAVVNPNEGGPAPEQAAFEPAALLGRQGSPKKRAAAMALLG